MKLMICGIHTNYSNHPSAKGGYWTNYSEGGGEGEKMAVDRVANWQKFSRHMEHCIREQTVGKYSIERSGQFDLMSITRQPIICVWNILRSAFRIWNDNMKERDLEKIAHYAELAWTLWEGKIIKNDRDDA